MKSQSKDNNEKPLELTSDFDSGSLPQESIEKIFSDISFSLTDNEDEEPEGSGYGSDFEINTAHHEFLPAQIENTNNDQINNNLSNQLGEKVDMDLYDGKDESGKRADVNSISNLSLGNLRQFNWPLPEIQDAVLKFNGKIKSVDSNTFDSNSDAEKQITSDPSKNKLKVVDSLPEDLVSKKNQASTGSSTDKWNEEDCYVNGFSRCLNGGICSASMKRCFCASGFHGDRCQHQNCDATKTLVNGTCSNFDLLIVKVKTPGIARMVKELGIPLRELSSKSATSLGARDVLREHVLDKLTSRTPTFALMQKGSASALIAEFEQEQKDLSPRSSALVAGDVAQAEALTGDSTSTFIHKNKKHNIDPETLGISVEWFDLGENEIEAKIKLSLPLGSGHDMTKWESLLKSVLNKSPILDTKTIKIEDFNECNTEVNRCSSKHNTICENLIGSYQCRCLTDPKTGLPSEDCQDPCLTTNGQPVCGNNGRCSPILAAQKSIHYENSYDMSKDKEKYAYLEERLENIYDMNSDPTCSCTEGFSGDFCEFQQVEDNSLLITVWVISAILFVIIIMLLGRKIYDLTCRNNVSLDNISGPSTGVNRNGSFLTAAPSVYGNRSSFKGRDNQNFGPIRNYGIHTLCRKNIFRKDGEKIRCIQPRVSEGGVSRKYDFLTIFGFISDLHTYSSTCAKIFDQKSRVRV